MKKRLKIKWDAILELIILIFNLIFVANTYLMMFSNKIRIGYARFVLFFMAIGTIAILIESLTDRFNNSKE